MRVPLPYDPDRRRRLGGDNPCLLCGRRILGTARMVEVDRAGQAIVDEQDQEDSLGAFPVGPDCWKKVQKAIKEAK